MADRIGKGITPAARPTEWTTAVAMLSTAAILFTLDRNIAALVATAGAALPVIITALVETARSRFDRDGE